MSSLRCQRSPISRGAGAGRLVQRLARSLHDLITLTVDLRKRGIGFKSLHESLDTTTPGGRLVFHVFAALAEFIRELIIEDTREGLAAAKARGQQHMRVESGAGDAEEFGDGFGAGFRLS